MIQINFSADAKVRLKVWPDVCDLCGERVPVTHVKNVLATGQCVEDKLCARCGVAYETNGTVDRSLIGWVNGEIEYDPREEDL